MMSLLLAVIYLSFISLGLPDSLLGSAWPLMYQELQVPVSYAGGISMIISAGTIFSSLQSDRLTKKFGPGAGNGGKRRHDGRRPFRLFHQPFLRAPLLLGGSLWAGGRVGGRGLK